MLLTPASPRTSALLAALTLVTATATTAHAQGGTPATHQHAAPATSSAAAPKVEPADVAFMQGMIHHHTQALVMTAMMDARTTDRTMRLLGERITVSQQDEIAVMREWLRERAQTAPSGDPAHLAHEMGDHAMPGMLTPAQLDTLAAARGVEFEKLFLRYMIQHHQGAVVMVKQLFATPGAGQEPQLFGFATDVEADQTAEIRRMQQMLSTRTTSTKDDE